MFILNDNGLTSTFFDDLCSIEVSQMVVFYLLSATALYELVLPSLNV